MAKLKPNNTNIHTYIPDIQTIHRCSHTSIHTHTHTIIIIILKTFLTVIC